MAFAEVFLNLGKIFHALFFKVLFLRFSFDSTAQFYYFHYHLSDATSVTHSSEKKKKKCQDEAFCKKVCDVGLRGEKRNTY